MHMRKVSKSILNFWSPVLCLLVLGGLIGVSWSRPQPEDAEPYHQRIRSYEQFYPVTRVANWTSDAVPVPAQAQALLKPNVVISRKFRNTHDGRFVNFLLVQCRDGRDMAGHFPKNCYPGNGWKLKEEQARTWHIEGDAITGMEYEFTISNVMNTQNRLMVYNFFIMGDGRYLPDMVVFNRASQSYATRYLGGSQVQMVFWGEWTQQDRDEVFEELLTPYMPLIRVIKNSEEKRRY